jgi:hypothetical protein
VRRIAVVLCAVLLLGSPRTGWAAEAQSAGTVDSDAAPEKAPDPSASRKNPFVPIFDIAAFEALVNRYGFYVVDRGTYDVSARSVSRNLRSPWVLDSDPFAINQFLHPAQGAMYHGFARSAGLNYWESLGYTFAGSALWEIAGETTLPSRNDQIATGLGGTFLGEPLFRLANLVLERADGLPPFWRALSAAIISPATGFNRVVYGGRFKSVFPSGAPSFFTRLQVGAMGTASAQKGLGQRLENEAAADFSIDYGLPGNPRYEYHRPFDYFNLQFTASSANHFENIFTRGLLAGQAYGSGAARYRGVWGVYGTYDYVAPQLFRVSSTAVSLGTTLERRLSASSALQSTTLAGVGYGAAGTIHARLSLRADAAGARLGALHRQRPDRCRRDAARLLRQRHRVARAPRLGEHRAGRHAAHAAAADASGGVGSVHLVTPRRRLPGSRRCGAVARIGRPLLHVPRRHAFRDRRLVGRGPRRALAFGYRSCFIFHSASANSAAHSSAGMDRLAYLHETMNIDRSSFQSDRVTVAANSWPALVDS